MTLLEKLSSFNGIKLKDAVYDKKTKKCTVSFLYNPSIFNLPDNVGKLESVLREYIDKNVELETKFVKCLLEKSSIAVYVYMTITNNFPVISKGFSVEDISITISGLDINVSLAINPTMFEYASKSSRNEDIAQKLSENFYGNFSVNLVKKADFVGDSSDSILDNIEFQNSIKMLEQKQMYKLSNVKNLIGNADFNMALDFSSNTSLTDCVICGVITKCDRRTYKRKQQKNGEQIEVEKIFYLITIANDGKFISCTYFPRVADEKKAELLNVGDKIALQGKFDNYNGRVTFLVNSICLCDFENYVPPVQTKGCNSKYYTVFPKEYVDYEQNSIFDTNDDVKTMTTDYVVFDFETTGLDCRTEEIIEVGAVKISGGKIVSTFSSFVKPSKHIPTEITNLTGIDDSMVENAPSINYVLPDFYKYCYNCAIVGHNINFDYGFLNMASKKLMYNFDNKQYDTLAMARAKLRGVKNYKLETVADYLKVSLVGAHRAVNDALATAKVFLKLI